MATGRTGGFDGDAFERTRRRLTAWRASRRTRGRLPEDLWRPAVRLAVQYGISKTSRALRLGFRELKARVERSAAHDSPGRQGHEGFVELRGGAGLLGLCGPECLIEVECRGAGIRITLNGQGRSELPSVIETLVGRSGR
jgi:hypothetical protein